MRSGVDAGGTIERAPSARQLALRNGRDDTTVRYQCRLLHHREHAVRVTVLEQPPVTHSQRLTVQVLPAGRCAGTAPTETLPACSAGTWT